MRYKFPLINTIDDVLPYVKDHPAFVIADKGTYIVINYYSVLGDPFGSMQSREKLIRGAPTIYSWDEGDIIRRECRGIIFDKATGLIIARRYHKFFNVNERNETMSDFVDMSKPHTILEKLDGSMITPFRTSDGILHWGTKMGETDTVGPVLDFLEYNPKYIQFANWCIDQGITPIFEWCSRDNRVVIDHPEPRLVLTALRFMQSGKYSNLTDLTGNEFVIPTVFGMPGGHFSMEKLIADARALVGEEGYVIRFDDGHMLKVKSDWYVAIHKAKENILYERNVVRLIMDEKIDDVLPFLMDSDRDRLTRYLTDFGNEIDQMVQDVLTITDDAICRAKMDRKTFALTRMADVGPFARIVFQHFDEIQRGDFTFVDMKKACLELIYAKTSSNTTWSDFKKSAGIDVDFNATTTEE